MGEGFDFGVFDTAVFDAEPSEGDSGIVLSASIIRILPYHVTDFSPAGDVGMPHSISMPF
jgi:hypothetical protein